MSKATVTYHAPQGDNRVVDMGGQTFFDGKPVDLDHDEHAGLIKKLRTNQHFEVVGGEPSNGPTSNALIAKHKGRGVYSIVRGQETIVEGLSGEDAKTFNAMGDEEKTAFIETALADPAA